MERSRWRPFAPHASRVASALAIISKAVFEKLAPGGQPGAILAIDNYASTHKSLEALLDRGALFLVTVRPPAAAIKPWKIAKGNLVRR